MTDAMTAILCTVLLAAGWFYLTQSRSVERLQGLESPRRNATRRRARRLGAWSMIVLGSSWFWLMWEFGRGRPNPRLLPALLLVLLALLTMLLCALVDAYLTMRLKRSNRPPK